MELVEEPDLFIYLGASKDTLLNRIGKRDRTEEEFIEEDFVIGVSEHYDRFFNKLASKMTNTEVLHIHTEDKTPAEIAKTALEFITSKTALNI